MRNALLLAMTMTLPPALHAQRTFATPDSVGKAGIGGVKLGLFGFSAKGGADFQSGGRVIAGVGLDLGDLFTDRVRFRPSFEIGMGDTVTYVGSAELMYRFTPDSVIAVPYILFGFGLYGQQGCKDIAAIAAVNPLVASCPRVLLQFGLGFELKIDEHFSWLLEYHGEDALRRHRVLVGLTTKRAR
jgi:hypothetical protein